MARATGAKDYSKCIDTYTGKKINPAEASCKDIDMVDIAHGLSQVCRYNGQCKTFYSVAQHSLNCAAHIKRLGMGSRAQLLGLLHDAAEAYISDIPRPIKQHLPTYHVMEKDLMGVIYNALDITPPSKSEQALIDWVDAVMLATEARELMNFNDWGEEWENIEPDGNADLTPQCPKDVEDIFLRKAIILLGSARGGNVTKQP